MVVKPWFSHEAGKDFRKWENGGLNHYHELGEGRKRIVSRLTGLAHTIFDDDLVSLVGISVRYHIEGIFLIGT